MAELPLIETAMLTRSFAVGGTGRKQRVLQAVRGVGFRLLAGEVLAIVGESGCGKTTLARMILGLLPPTSGDVQFSGEPIQRMSRLGKAAFVQPVFQDPYASLNPQKRIGEIIGLPLRLQGRVSRGELRLRVHAMMELVGLSPALAGRMPSELSGGQRQRVAIARALIVSPKVVVCDEPTSALDVSVQAQILNLLQELREKLNLAYLLISHNLAVVEHLADRIAVMYLGRIVETGTVDEVLDRPRHPYTRTLLASILEPDPDKRLPEATLEASLPNPLDPPTGCAFHPRCPMATARCALEEPQTRPMPNGFVACHHADLTDPPIVTTSSSLEARRDANAATL